MSEADAALMEMVTAIVAADPAAASSRLATSPQLATAVFSKEVEQNCTTQRYLPWIGRYIVSGDTALLVAAAVYQVEIARILIEAGANVSAVDRHGLTALHAASKGNPESPRWNPEAQSATIRLLVSAGADVNGAYKRGVAPLHVAVRTRCADAVRTLLDCGADPSRPNANGSTPMLLATYTTGRGGSGSAEAKAQQQQIVELLRERQSGSR